MARNAPYLPPDFPEWILIPPQVQGDMWGIIRETEGGKTYYSAATLQEAARIILQYSPAPIRTTPPGQAIPHRTMSKRTNTGPHPTRDTP